MATNTALTTACLCLLLCAAGTAIGAPASEGGVLPPPGSAVQGGTANPADDANRTAVGQMQSGLDQIKQEIVAAVQQMQEANASTPAKQAEKVNNLAMQLRQLATNDLGETSQIVKNADALITKMKGQLSHARASASDPNVGAREIYLAVATKLEPELSKLIDARASVNQVRSELLRQAESLDQNAAAIGFAADADQTVLAANAFGALLTDIAQFTAKIEAMIDAVAKAPVT
jgi:polygalacturonase